MRSDADVRHNTLLNAIGRGSPSGVQHGSDLAGVGVGDPSGSRHGDCWRFSDRLRDA